MRPIRAAVATVVCAAAALAAPNVHAQAYPSKTVSLIVPFAAGGPADVVARLLGQKIAPELGQPVIVENRPGAGGTIAAAAVAKAPPDGHTILFVTAGHAGAAALYPSLPFDPVKDFAPVVGIAATPIVVVVNAASKYRTLSDLIADARARPGKLNFAGGGGGATVTNLAAEVFRSEMKLDVTNVPYKGSAPALVALIAGEIDYSFDNLSAVLGQIKAGKLRALAVTTRNRSSALPDVPTIAEGVLPGFEASTWFGILAPKGTPPVVVERLNRDFNAALRAPDTQARLKELGADPTGGSPAEFGSFLAAETTRWGGVIRKLGLKAE